MLISLSLLLPREVHISFKLLRLKWKSTNLFMMMPLVYSVKKGFFTCDVAGDAATCYRMAYETSCGGRVVSLVTYLCHGKVP